MSCYVAVVNSDYNQVTVFFPTLLPSGSWCHPRQKQLLKLLTRICSLHLAPPDFCIQRWYWKGQDFRMTLHIKQQQITAMRKYQTQIVTNQTVKTILVLYQHPRETDVAVFLWVNWDNQSCSLFLLTDCWSSFPWGEFIVIQLTISDVKYNTSLGFCFCFCFFERIRVEYC